MSEVRSRDGQGMTLRNHKEVAKCREEIVPDRSEWVR